MTKQPEETANAEENQSAQKGGKSEAAPAESTRAEPAPGEIAMGSAKVTVRVLIVARRAGSNDAAAREAAGVNPMRRLRGFLEAGDHTVSLVPPAQWEQAAASIRPDVILVEVSDVPDEAVNLCQEIRALQPYRAVLAVLPANQGTAVASLWSQLEIAGADDFITADIPREALNARVLLLARLANSLRDNEAALERLARHMQIDEATQLLNRRFFFQSAHREVSRARRYGHVLSCLMVDIDYLDDMGKTFGYSCVEYVLRAVAYTVRQWTRDSDVGGRFSERKFAILLPETDVEGAVAVREKILNAIADGRFVWQEKELPISVSIGEAERRYERAFGAGSTSAEEIETTAAKDEDAEASVEETETEPLSVREELATLLEDADAALSVARRASLRPGIFVQYTPGTPPNGGTQS